MNEPTTYLAILSEWHIILLVLVIFLLFGGKKLPELARGLGKSVSEFKRGQSDDEPAKTAERKTEEKKGA